MKDITEILMQVLSTLLGLIGWLVIVYGTSAMIAKGWRKGWGQHKTDIYLHDMKDKAGE